MNEASGLPFIDAKQLEKLKDMASNPKLSASLVQDDTWLGLLVLLVDGDDEELVKLTLEILKLLASHPEHRPRMKHFIGMTQQLEELLAKPRVSSSIKDLAQQVHSCLHYKKVESDKPQHQGDQSHAPLHDIKDPKMNRQKAGTKIGQKGRRNSMLVRQSGLAKSAKTVILQIKGMVNKDDMDLCRRQLVNVKGVISVTFNFKAKRSILRCRNELKPEELAQAIAKSIAMTAEQVVKDDQGEEVLISFKSKATNANKENLDMPDYPPDDSPIKGDNNMARMGDVPKDSPGGWTFIKSVGQYLSNSFYW